MAASLVRTYNSGFFLTEEALVRIQDIIRKRVPTLPQDAIQFSVTRNDGLSASYDTPSSLITDSNIRFSKVKELSIETKSTDLKFALSFSRQDGTLISLRTPDRDTAFLISSDLREYLQADVLSSSVMNRLSLPRVILFPLGSLAMVFPILYALAAPTMIPYQAALKAKDPNIKLNYLVELNGKLASSTMYKLMIVPFLIFILVVALQRLGAYLYPRNTFYFGKETDQYDRIRDLRSKLLWVVVVGIVVGVIATMIASRSGIG